MTGRLALLLVAGMAAAMVLVNATMNTSDAVDNFAGYYNRSVAYDIACSAANMFSNRLYFNKTLRGEFSDTLNGGSWTVTIDTASGMIRVVSVGTYPAGASIADNVEKQQVIQSMRVGYFDRFVVLTDNDDGSVPWTTGDTAKGALHSNNTLRMDHYSGNPLMPVFLGRVTTLHPITITSGTDPFFAAGAPQSGIYIEFPTTFGTITEPPFLLGAANFNHTINAGGGAISFTTKKELHLQFYVDGLGTQMVRYYRNGYRSSNNGYGDFSVSDSTMPVPSSGIIYEPGVDVYVEGTVKNKLSVLTTPDALGNGGNIIVTNDLLCNTDPKTNPGSGDLIGLLAQKNVIIGNTTNNAASTNGSETFRIEASIVALTGGLAAADNSSRRRQYLDVYGSITQKFRRAVGDGSDPIVGAGHTGGFIKKYMYDQRLYNDHALLMPQTGLLVLESYLISTVL
jgi:hypothetical protein